VRSAARWRDPQVCDILANRGSAHVRAAFSSARCVPPDGSKAEMCGVPTGGYTLKPQDVVVTHPTSTVVQTAHAPITDTCIFVDHHKGC
jgi:hypothetical protein